MSIRSLYNCINLYLHCCFSGSMKVQSVVGCFRSKFLLKSLIETYIGYFVFLYQSCMEINFVQFKQTTTDCFAVVS